MRTRRASLGILGLYIDADFVSALVVRASSAASSLLTAWLILHYLTPIEQGYWYAFTSILAVAAFAELGAGQIILRLVAQEYGKLDDGARHERAIGRLRNLFWLCIRWGAVVSAVVAVLALPIGYWWMAADEQVPGWRFAWLISTFAVAPTFFVGFLNSYFEGWQRVTVTNRLRTLAVWVLVLSMWACLAAGFGLMAYGVCRLISALAGIVMAWVCHGELMRSKGLTRSGPVLFSWRKEFLPLQSQYALSWAAGIFVNGLYAPLIFRFAGAEKAGQFGMTLSIVGVVSGIAMSAAAARQARLAALAGRRAIEEFDGLCKQVSKTSCVLYCAGAVPVLVVFLMFPGALQSYSDRFLSAAELAIALVAGLFWSSATIQCIIVRSLGVEPFVRVMWAQAMFSASCAIPAIALYGVYGALTVSAVGNFVLFVVCRYLRFTKLADLERKPVPDPSGGGSCEANPETRVTLTSEK